MEKKTGESRAGGSRGNAIHDATCINIMARFVQIARLSGESNLRLQDKNIVDKITLIAERTENPQLKILHKRLQEKLRQTAERTNNKQRIDAIELKSDVRSKFAEWTQIFK